MFRQSIGLSLVLCLLPFNPVMSSFFCKDSTIDSIAYANDQHMYFIASGGHYWWIKETGFPPKDSEAKPVVSPFTKTTAAVYIDGDNGCQVKSRVAGMRAKEKEVWVTEIIDGKQKLMALDTKYGSWGQPIDYDEDHCISKARIDFDKPIDAMFTRNYLEVFLVQGDRYAMVDCRFLCTDPVNRFGDDKPDSNIQDFGTKDPIYGMLVISENKNEKLLMFQKKVYYVMEIRVKQSINGKVIANKVGAGKNVLTDFLRVKTDTECTGPETPPPLVEDSTNADNNEEPPPPEAEQPNQPEEEGGNEDTDSQSSTSAPSEGGSGLWIIIAIIVVVLIVVAVGLCLLFAMKSKKSEDTEASKPEPKSGSKTGSKIDSKVGGPSKVGSKIGGKPTPQSAIAPNMSTRSGMGKSSIPKSSTGSAKSSASKK